jgi:hypothetical protein
MHLIIGLLRGVHEISDIWQRLGQLLQFELLECIIFVLT